MPRISLTPFQKHVRDWGSCDRCHLHEIRTKICLARGSIPCDVLFLGEAPGKNEDIIGLPFIGPAGNLLDYIIGRAWSSLSSDMVELTWAMTNLICCAPLEGEGHKVEPPSIESVVACTPRLREFILQVAQPRLLVCVGLEAAKWLDPKRYRTVSNKEIAAIPQIEITHPAAMLQAKELHKKMAIDRAIVVLTTGIMDHLNR